MDLMMGALGVRGMARDAPAQGGLEVAVTSDALAVRTTSERTTGLMGAEADVTRLRFGVDGTRHGGDAARERERGGRSGARADAAGVDAVVSVGPTPKWTAGERPAGGC